MSPTQINIAIAEACGWKIEPTHNPKLTKVSRPDGTYEITLKPEVWLPDYYHDLNAVHEAEKTFNNKQRHRYEKRLQSIVATGNNWDRPESEATAAQRCEAFLRTLSLWKEQPTEDAK